MERLIDATALVEKICGDSCGCHRDECGYTYAENGCDNCSKVREIEEAPTIDPVLTIDSDRLLLLPCKVGGYYWKVTQTRTVDGKPRPLHVRGMRLSWETVGKVAQEYGKTAFSTHAEAKAALKRAMAEWLKEQEEAR